MQIWQRMKSHLEDLAEENGLSLPQVFLLYTLYKDDDILMGAIAKRLHCDASNITGLVDRLESRSLIKRQEVSGDRRAKQITITKKGRVLVDALLARMHENIGLEKLTKKETDTLHILLEKINS